MDYKWFNAGFGQVGKFKLFNLFNRKTVNGNYWGVGLCQYANRHLFYVGSSGISIVWIGKTS